MIVQMNDSPVRILYVEDDKDIRAPMTQILTLLGYQIRCAENGLEGIEAAESWKPDIILMDLRLPVMDGPTAIRILRNRADTAHIPIFVLTAYSDAKNRKLCKEAGADRFFVKPIDMAELDAAISETRQRQTQSGIRPDPVGHLEAHRP